MKGLLSFSSEIVDFSGENPKRVVLFMALFGYGF